MAAFTGVVVAGGYRWASSWSVVTLTPYLDSLATLHPRVELIASTPFVVRLHVVAAFATVVLVPFTRAGSALLGALTLVAQAAAWSMADAVDVIRERLHLAPGRVLRSYGSWPGEER
jgi:nitrate reductase gamma subunit